MKYKINRNQTPLTEGELSSARNFNQALKGYRAMKAPFYRRGKFLTGGSAIIVGAAIALMVVFDDKGEILGNENSPYIAPPIAQVNIAADTYTVDADSTTDIDYTSGSKLHIPAGAFKDASGNPVKGKVTLKYREFHDQKDIFISGIPMIYDSAGSKYVFESAGMMEITAWQDGKALQANNDKPIKVDMVSNTAEDRYNTYYLDTAEKKWVNLNQANLLPGQKPTAAKGGINPKDTLSVDTKAYVEEMENEPLSSNPALSKYVQEVRRTVAEVKAVEKEKPMAVTKADKNKQRFSITVDPTEFPEIAIYKGVKFQVKDEKSFDQASAKVEWEDVKLKKLTGIDYEITFSKGAKTFKVVATPVLQEKDMAEAQKVYDRKFAEYQTKLNDKKAAEEKARKEYEARAKAMEVEMQKAIAAQKERDRVYEASLNRTQLIYRTFSVYRFGTYNCDSPVGWPTESNVVASLTDENGNKLNLRSFNLVEKGRNAIFPYTAESGQCKNFRFNGSKENMIWAMTDDNKLAIVDAKSFKEQKANRTFKFKLVDEEFKTSDEVKKYLDI